jgi:hypothetical protein
MGIKFSTILKVALVGAAAVMLPGGGAVAAAALQGLYVGAAIGAATALITKKPIFEGALNGAIIGGITGGAVKYAQVGNAGLAAEAGTKAATDTAVKTGAQAVVEGGANAAPSTMTTDMVIQEKPLGLIQNASGGPAGSANSVMAEELKASRAAMSGMWKWPVYAGMATGATQTVFGSAMAGKAEEKALEKKYEYESRMRADNQAFDFGGLSPAQNVIARVTVPDNWRDITASISAPLTAYRPNPPGLLQTTGGA